MAKRRTKPVQFGQGKKREDAKKAAKVKAPKEPKEPKVKKGKGKTATPADGTMDEHDLLAEIRNAEKALRDAEVKRDAAKEDLKAASGNVTAKFKKLRDLTGDTADGQQRINFSRPVEEYHQKLPEVHSSQPWRTLPIDVLNLGKRLFAKLDGGGISKMGDVVAACKEAYFVQNYKLTDNESIAFNDAMMKFYEEHPEALSDKKTEQTGKAVKPEDIQGEPVEGSTLVENAA